MLEACQQYVVAKRSNLTHWHPVLGWFAQTIDTSLQDATPSVKLQLACLWTGRIVTHLIGEGHQFYPRYFLQFSYKKCISDKDQFALCLLSIFSLEQPLTEFVEKEVPSPIEQQSTSSIGANIFRRAFLEARTNRNNSTKNYRKLGSPEATKIALICSLYQTALHTLTQMKIEILTGTYNKLAHNHTCKLYID